MLCIFINNDVKDGSCTIIVPSHEHMSFHYPGFCQCLPSLSIWFILEMNCTAECAAHHKNKYHGHIGHLCWTCHYQSEAKIIWWCFVYWTQWYHICDSSWDYDCMRHTFIQNDNLWQISRQVFTCLQYPVGCYAHVFVHMCMCLWACWSGNVPG